MTTSPQHDIEPTNWRPMDVRAGQIDWKIRAHVSELILQTTEFVVYLDDKLTTQWWMTTDLPAAAGPVLNRVAELESIPIDSLPQSIQHSFRTLIAEGVARVLDENDTSSAEAMHATAERFIRARLGEQARSWYLQSALIALVIIAGIMGAIEICYRAGLEQLPDGVRRFLLCLGAGGVGAAFSLIVRIGSFPLDPAAGRDLHGRESVARVIVGIVGAFVAYLAVATKQVAPALTNGEFTALLFVAFVAGSSERFVPNLIARADRQLEQEPGKADDASKRKLTVVDGDKKGATSPR
jgi:hypothetical protein